MMELRILCPCWTVLLLRSSLQGAAGILPCNQDNAGLIRRVTVVLQRLSYIKAWMQKSRDLCLRFKLFFLHRQGLNVPVIIVPYRNYCRICAV